MNRVRASPLKRKVFKAGPAKIDIDRVEYARGEVRDFVSGGRKKASYFKVSDWTSTKEELNAGDEIDIVIDLSSCDLFGYKGGSTPVTCPGYLIDGKRFVFVQPTK